MSGNSIFNFCNNLLVQTNNGGRGQTIAVAVDLRIFQIAGFAKTGLPFRDF